MVTKGRWVVMDTNEQWGHTGSRRVVNVSQKYYKGNYIVTTSKPGSKRISSLGTTRTQSMAIMLARKYVKNHPRG